MEYGRTAASDATHEGILEGIREPYHGQYRPRKASHQLYYHASRKEYTTANVRDRTYKQAQPTLNAQPSHQVTSHVRGTTTVNLLQKGRVPSTRFRKAILLTIRHPVRIQGHAGPTRTNHGHTHRGIQFYQVKRPGRGG